MVPHDHGDVLYGGRLEILRFASNNFGALLGGTSVRYRLYSSFGLAFFEIVKISTMLLATFSVGLSSLAAAVFLVHPIDWLSEQNAAEKWFSLGNVQEDYIRRFPAALIRQNGRIVAFANLWAGENREELKTSSIPSGVLNISLVPAACILRECSATRLR